MTHDVIAYDIWGNKKDGWEVNNAFKIGEVDLSQVDKDKEITKRLKKAGFINSKVRYSSVEIEGDHDYSLFVNDVRGCAGGYRPVFELRAIS